MRADFVLDHFAGGDERKRLRVADQRDQFTTAADFPLKYTRLVVLLLFCFPFSIYEPNLIRSFVVVVVATEWIHNHSGIVRGVLEERSTVLIVNETAHRDSGTSSPIHAENGTDCTPSSRSIKIIARSESQLTSFTIHPNDLPKGNSFERHRAHSDETEEELSDSNDSVFSSGSSIDSILNYSGHDHNGDEPESFDMRDIYLGGSCALRSTWYSDVIEMLNEKDITYHVTQLHDSLRAPEDLDGRLSTSPPPSQNEPCTSKSLEPSSSNDSGIGSGLPRHSYRTTGGTVICTTGRRMFNLAMLESSRVLLFVITNETRSLAPMTLAAHCIGLGYNVVLCVQMMSEGTSIGDDKVRVLF